MYLLTTDQRTGSLGRHEINAEPVVADAIIPDQVVEARMPGTWLGGLQQRD